MATTGFRGLRTTQDYTITGMRPENWREGILMLNPRGDTIITALTTMMPSRKSDDAKFHWYTQAMVRQGGSFTAGQVYLDPLFASAYVSGGVAGDVVHVKATTLIAQFIRVGHNVSLRNSTYLIDTIGKVMEIQQMDATYSRVSVKLLEADDNGASVSKDLSDADTILVVGNSNPEGSGLPPSLVHDPTEFNSYTEIFKTAFDISRTAMHTRLRTGDEYQRQKLEKLTYHGVEMEKAFLWHVPTQTNGENGKVERTTGGIKYWITNYNSAGVSDYRYDTNYSGQAWGSGGWDWIEAQIQTMQKYQAGQSLWLCGPGAIAGINKLARSAGHIQLQPGETSFGLKIMQWFSPFGTFQLKEHPLLNLETTENNSIYVIRPEHLQYVYIDDTNFLEDNSWEEGGAFQRDGKVEGWITECGLELHHPETFAYWTGVGLDNNLT